MQVFHDIENLSVTHDTRWRYAQNLGSGGGRNTAPDSIRIGRQYFGPALKGEQNDWTDGYTYYCHPMRYS